MDVALARLIGFCIDIFLTVIYTILWVGAMLTLRNKKGDNLSAVIPAVLILMYILNTAQLCLQAADVYRAFFKFNNYPGGDDDYFKSYGSKILPARDAIFWIMSILADALVIWRLYIIWLRNKFVVIAPVLLLLGGFTSGVVMYVYTVRRTIETTARLAPLVDKWWEITLGFTIAVNIITPGLIIGRLWHIARQVGVLGSQSVWPYKHIASALAESGSLYTFACTAWLIIFLTKSLPALFLSATLLPTIVALVPVLMILRINGNINDNPLSRLRHLHMSSPNWIGSNGIQISVTQHQTSSGIPHIGDGSTGSVGGSVFPRSKSASPQAADSMDEETVDDHDDVDDVEKQHKETLSPPSLSRQLQYNLPAAPPASALPQRPPFGPEYMEMNQRR